jgi:hypothetical protein
VECTSLQQIEYSQEQEWLMGRGAFFGVTVDPEPS